jgi:hypothetical protein
MIAKLHRNTALGPVTPPPHILPSMLRQYDELVERSSLK